MPQARPGGTVNWTKIRQWNAFRATQKSRLASLMTPEDRVAAASKRWSAMDARKWTLEVELEGEAKRVTLKVDWQSIVLACMSPVPPYKTSLGPLYAFGRVGTRDMTPAAFDVLEKRVLSLVNAQEAR